jgi:hypothetical protein
MADQMHRVKMARRRRQATDNQSELAAFRLTRITLLLYAGLLMLFL